MSEGQDKAKQKAFERGQSDWREGKPPAGNPYPPQSPYYILWEQGWHSEHDVHYG